MKFTSLLPLLFVGLFASAFGNAAAQSYFDDDIYYDASKASAKTKNKVERQTYTTPSTVIVAEYPAADTYTVNSTRQRTISVDDYNRRGIFATDTLTADTTATDFAYTRRIEQFYNPQIVSGSNDQELAQIYYMEPETVNIYVNTPSSYWGYDYFYPDFGYYSPYWNFNWRWGSPWYWSSWYDPYWAWGPSWGWGWGPAWGWGPSYGWGWGPAWGWGPSYGWGWGMPAWNNRPINPRHQGARPSHTASRPSLSGTGNRPGLGSSNSNRYLGTGSVNNAQGYRPGVGYTRPATSVNANRNSSVNSNRGQNSVNQTSRNPSHNSTPTYNYPSNTNGGRTYNYNSGSSGSRGGSIGGSYGGGHSSGGRSSAGGRGRH